MPKSAFEKHREKSARNAMYQREVKRQTNLALGVTAEQEIAQQLAGTTASTSSNWANYYDYAVNSSPLGYQTITATNTSTGRWTVGDITIPAGQMITINEGTWSSDFGYRYQRDPAAEEALQRAMELQVEQDKIAHMADLEAMIYRPSERAMRF